MATSLCLVPISMSTDTSSSSSSKVQLQKSEDKRTALVAWM